ncbi:MAG: preprotein translocase subunit SecE [Hornefia sp.]|nr:preprotein translocase subunit SecE [Hornefia sp.]
MAKSKPNKPVKKEPLKDARTKARRMAMANSQKQSKTSSLEYWKGVKQEMAKVVWPTKKELVTFTGVVIVTCAAFALAFWAMDSAFLAALRAVLGITLS